MHGIQSSPSWIPFFSSRLGSLYPIGFLCSELTLLIVPWADCPHTVFSATKTILLLEAQLWFNSKTTFFMRPFWNPLKSKTIGVWWEGEGRERKGENVGVLCQSWSYSTIFFPSFVIIFCMSLLITKLKTLKSRIFISCLPLSPHSTKYMFQLKVSVRMLDSLIEWGWIG